MASVQSFYFAFVVPLLTVLRSTLKGGRRWRWGVLDLHGHAQRLGMICEPLGPAFAFRVLLADGTFEDRWEGRGALREFTPLPEERVRRMVVTREARGHGADESFVPSPVLPGFCAACGLSREACDGQRAERAREAERARIEDRARDVFARICGVPFSRVRVVWSRDAKTLCRAESDFVVGRVVTPAQWEAARAEGLPLGDHAGQGEESEGDEEDEPEDEPDPAAPETVFVLELTVKGDPDAARAAVASALDGDLGIQDAVNAHESDAGPVRVTHALVVSERDAAAEEHSATVGGA